AMKSKLIKLFILSSAFLLIITCAAKFVSAMGEAPVLDKPDRFFLLSHRTVFWVVGSIELVIAAVCLLTKRPWLQTVLLAWLATNFIGYRLALETLNVHDCSCLGTLADALPFDLTTINRIMLLILAYLALGSYISLLCLWRERRKNRRSLSSPAYV